MRALLCALVMSMTASIRAPTSVAAAVPSCAKEKADSLVTRPTLVGSCRAGLQMMLKPSLLVDHLVVD
jgi:hypothetical protein